MLIKKNLFTVVQALMLIDLDLICFNDMKTV